MGASANSPMNPGVLGVFYSNDSSLAQGSGGDYGPSPYTVPGQRPAIAKSYEFTAESLAADREVIRTEGIRGTRLHPQERVRQGRQTVNGGITMEPTYAELVQWLPRIFGPGTPNGVGATAYTNFALAEATGQLSATLPTGMNGSFTFSSLPKYFTVLMDRSGGMASQGKQFYYDNCKINRVTFRGGPGRPLQMSMEIEALQENPVAYNTVTMASGLAVSATAPFIFEDGVLNLGGTTGYQFMEFETTIDWHLKTDRWVNNLTRTDLTSTDLTVSCRFTLPYTQDEVGLYDASNWAQTGGFYGISGDLKFAWDGGGGDGSTGVSLHFFFNNLIFPAKKSPVIHGKDEITLMLEGEVRSSGSFGSIMSPLYCTLDSTP